MTVLIGVGVATLAWLWSVALRMTLAVVNSEENR